MIKALLRLRLVSDGLWVACGQVLSALAVLTSIRVLTEYLAPADYGLMALILTTASTITSLVIGVVGEGILVYYSRFKASDGGATFRKAAAGFGRQIGAALSLATLAVGLTLTSISTPYWPAPFLIAGILIVDSVRYFELMLFTAARRQRAAATVQICDTWLRLGASWLALVLFQANAYTALIGNLAGSLILLTMIRLVLRPVGRDRQATGSPAQIMAIRTELKRLFPTLMPAKLLANIFDIGSRYAIAAILGLSGTGVYSACSGLARRPFGMLNSISDWTMKPVLAQALAQQDAARASRIRLYWAAAIGTLSLAGVMLIYLLRQPIVALLLGDRYIEATNILPIMAAGIGIFTATNVLNSILIVEARPKTVLVSNLAGTVTGLGATIWLSWHYGLAGAAWGLVAGFLAFGIVALSSYALWAQDQTSKRWEG